MSKDMSVKAVIMTAAEMRAKGMTDVEILNYLNTLTVEQRFGTEPIKPIKLISIGANTVTGKIVSPRRFL